MSIKQWLKRGDSPIARLLFRCAKAIVYFEIPCIRPIHGLLYRLHLFVTGLVEWIGRVFYYTPLFKSRLAKCGRRLYLYTGMSMILGPLRIELGDDCRISGKTSFFGRSSAAQTPELIVGNNIDIGWMTTIAVGTRVILKDNVRIAQQAYLAGFPGHPLDPVARAAGAAETDDQVGDIILEEDVWLASRVIVLPGVTIGRGTVVGAGSIVTKSLPPGVLAAGCPAKVLRSIEPSDAPPMKEIAG